VQNIVTLASSPPSPDWFRASYAGRGQDSVPAGTEDQSEAFDAGYDYYEETYGAAMPPGLTGRRGRPGMNHKIIEARFYPEARA
jgi:hypothetical protein